MCHTAQPRPQIIYFINFINSIMTITITVEKDGYYEVNGTRHEPTVSLYVIPAASKLRRMLRDTKDLIVCPGVYDGLSARVAMELGFKGLYMVRKPVSICLLNVFNAHKKADRRWHNCFPAGDGGSGLGPTARHAYQCRDDRKSRSIWASIDCGHGSWLRR